MSDILSLLIIGLATASIYAVAASGLVVTYTTSGIFNFAHGAVAMFTAFVYWQLSSDDAWGLPVPVALVLSLLVFAPGLGVLIDRVLMRRLHGASQIAKIVTSVALLVVLIQLATVIWPPSEVNARLPLFFPGESVQLGDVAVTYHQIVVFAVAAAVAVGLRIFLYQTRTGVAMRAVVDNRELAGLNGVDADRVSSLAWALGCFLAGVAGILIGPILSLDQATLTLLVINAYAAAMVGRLRSLPLTALGALILGILRESASRYSADLPSWITPDTVPVIMLFVVVIVVPQDRATVFSDRRDRSRVPNPKPLVIWGGAIALVASAAVLPSVVHGTALDTVGMGLALAIVASSLVALTGYGGQISLAPLAFGGLGAVITHQIDPEGNALAVLGATLACAFIGALVALPTVRLKGLYLALSTMAFAIFCEKAVFNRVDVFKDGNARFDRISIFGLDTSDDRTYLILMAVVLAVVGVATNYLRRGPFGRSLQSMKDSPAACATLGLDTNRLKLEAFALSAGIAGLGGALLAGWRGSAGPDQFGLLQGLLPGLPLVLMAVVGGIASIAGVLLGSMLLAMIPLVADTIPALRNLLTVAPGFAGIGIGANPNGAIAQTAEKLRERAHKRRSTDRSAATSIAATLAPRSSVLPEEIPVGAGLSAEQRLALDSELGLNWSGCRVDP